jgi:pimeloyl-ACP methyl ester carboxylesterase
MFTRHFVETAGRQMHYWRVGNGPPALLVHSSPANATLLHPEMTYLADRHTLFAFDTPGFGQSEPLPGADLTIGDLADALALAIDVVGLPACPVYGTHTGAAIALELGVRHPQRVTGLVLDGVPIFTAEEIERYFGAYFQPLPVTALGGVYTEAWTRFRDQSIWFPWNRRSPDNLNDYDLAPASSTHRWVSMYFDAHRHYVPAYRAALGYGPRAVDAIKALERPALFCASETDMLSPHLARIPALRPEQSICRTGRSHDIRHALIAERFAAYGAAGPAPARPSTLASSTRMQRAFVAANGEQLHIRYRGDPGSSHAIMLIHDCPGSGQQWTPLIEKLEGRAMVIAPDLPGSGHSAAGADQTLDGWVLQLEQILQQTGHSALTILGLGFGSAVAARLAQSVEERQPNRIARLILAGLPLPDDAEREELISRYAPPIAIAEDGSHWYRCWLMLRDAMVWWPWYRRQRDRLHRREMMPDADELHDRVVETMRAQDTYGDVARAALSEPWSTGLEAWGDRLVLVAGAPTALSVFDREMRGRCPDARIETLPNGATVASLAGLVTAADS